MFPNFYELVSAFGVKLSLKLNQMSSCANKLFLILPNESMTKYTRKQEDLEQSKLKNITLNYFYFNN